MTTTKDEIDLKWERVIANDEKEINNVKKKINDQLSATINLLDQAHKILDSTYIKQVKESLETSQKNIEEVKKNKNFPFSGSRNIFGNKHFGYTYEQYMLYINREIGKYLKRTNDLIEKQNINLKKQLKSCNDNNQSTAKKISDKYLVHTGYGLIF